jgi:hypothetical protein
MEIEMTDRAVIHAILKGARDRIQDPANWCQNQHFILNNGQAKSFSATWFGDLKNVKACCADGALIIQCGGDQSGVYREASDALATATTQLFNDSDYADVNDSRNGHAKIMKAFDHAIAWAASE